LCDLAKEFVSLLRLREYRL